MKILLDIKDSKAAFFLEVLKNFSFVRKATPLSDAKADLMQDIRLQTASIHKKKKAINKSIPHLPR